MNKRESVEAAFEQLCRAICALSVGDIDVSNRARALEWLNECDSAIRSGFRERDAERERAEDSRIVKAYREGRLVEADVRQLP